MIWAARECCAFPREIHSLKDLKDDRHIHESSSYRDRLGVGIADSRKSNVSSKGATNNLRGLHPSLRCDDRKSGGVTARRNFNAGATSHDRNRTNDKRHKVYNRRDARQPLTALTALGLGQTMFGLRLATKQVCVPSRLVVWRAFFAPSSTANAILRQPIAARPVGCRSFLIGSCSSSLQQLKRAPLKIVGQGSAPAPSQREQSPSLALFVHVRATAVWWHVHVHASVVCCRNISRCRLRV